VSTVDQLPRVRDAVPGYAYRPVGVVAAVVAAVLGATANQYGYHRDELYFRMLGNHIAWGYVDQPPLTVLLAKAGIAVFGDSVWGLRLPAILIAVAIVLVSPLLTRELGGGAIAQGLTALGVSSTFLFVAGHMLLTATMDFLFWVVVLLFMVRALLRDHRWWLAAGATAGLSLYNKQLVVLLLLGFLAGVLIAGPRRVLADKWLWAGAGLGLVVGLPNLIYQIVNDWPQVTMARAIAEDDGTSNRITFIPFQLLLLGPVTVPIWIAGFRHLLARPQWRPLKALAWAYPVVCGIVLLTGGQLYYTFGLLVFLLAAGAVTLEERLDPRGVRGTTYGLIANSVVSMVFALPLIPVSVLGDTPIPAVNQSIRDQVGWPTYVDQVAEVYRGLPAADRTAATIIAGNYGEAGAIDRYGPARGLPAVYSGQNQLHDYGPPPATARVAILVGFALGGTSADFNQCAVAATLDNDVGVDNEEQGRSILICRDPVEPWSVLWPRYLHYD
jgi:hypothetical protein